MTGLKFIFFLTVTSLFGCTMNKREVISKWKDGKTRLERIYSDTPNFYLEREFYENGQVGSEKRFENSKPNGRSIAYYKDGNLLGIAYYRNGKINGEVTEFHKNGKLMFKGIQRDGELVGKAIHYYENGKPKIELFYRDDKKFVINEWDSSGKLIAVKTSNKSH